MQDDIKYELNELRKMHRELMQAQQETNRNLGELVGEVRVLIRDGAASKETSSDHEKRLRRLEEDAAQNRPFMELFKSLNAKLWFIIFGVVGGAIAVVYKMQQ